MKICTKFGRGYLSIKGIHMEKSYRSLLRRLAKKDLAIDISSHYSIIRARIAGTAITVSYPAICFFVQARLMSGGKDGLYRLTDKGKDIAKEKWFDERKEQLGFMGAERETK